MKVIAFFTERKINFFTIISLNSVSDLVKFLSSTRLRKHEIDCLHEIQDLQLEIDASKYFLPFIQDYCYINKIIIGDMYVVGNKIKRIFQIFYLDFKYKMI